MPIAEHLKDPLEVINVDKFEAGWIARTLFEPFAYRLFIKGEENFIKAYQRITELKKQLRRFGEEDVDWIYISGKELDELDQVYVKHMTVFLRWKMQDSDDFKTWVDHVECHNPKAMQNEQTRNN